VVGLRVLTYNVRSMRDDRAALGQVIRSAEPDVVLVQESPRFAHWRSLCAQLARVSNLVVVGGGRPAGSNLILCTLEVSVVSTADVLFSKDRGLHRRGTAIAVLTKQGRRFAVASTHLDLDPAPRLRHVAELDMAIAAHVPAGVPVVIGADVNDHPGSPAWLALTAQRSDAAGTGSGPTYPSRDPRRRIDGIFADPALRVSAVRVLDGPEVQIASDHRPVLVELHLPPG
jgi:endonuclease/exonuclease/phosphatase family metal-dependent hydrolase